MSRQLHVSIVDQLVIEALELEALRSGRTVEQVIGKLTDQLAAPGHAHQNRSDALTGKVGRLVRQGLTDHDVAEQLRISYSSAARKRRLLGLPVNRLNSKKEP